MYAGGDDRLTEQEALGQLETHGPADGRFFFKFDSLRQGRDPQIQDQFDE